jgi:hypothetical protein
VIATERCLASAVCTSAEKMPRKHRLLAAQSCTVRLSSDHTVDLAWLRSARDPNMAYILQDSLEKYPCDVAILLPSLYRNLQGGRYGTSGRLRGASFSTPAAKLMQSLLPRWDGYGANLVPRPLREMQPHPIDADFWDAVTKPSNTRSQREASPLCVRGERGEEELTRCTEAEVRELIKHVTNLAACADARHRRLAISGSNPSA